MQHDPKVLTYPYERGTRDEDWERGRSPFVKSSVRGIQDWLLRLERDEIKFWRTGDRQSISFGTPRRNAVLRWYFLRPKPNGEDWIHFELVNATSSEKTRLKSHLSVRPRDTRNDDTFSFNVHKSRDLDLVKELVIHRFNLWVTENGKPERWIDPQTESARTDQPEASALAEAVSDENSELNKTDILSITYPKEQPESSVIRHHPRQGQGFQESPELRKVIENYAMDRAKVHFSNGGWSVQDHHSSQPYDLLCVHPSHGTIYVEVKGTTSDGKSLILTANEVRHAQDHYPNVALFVTAGINAETGISGQPSVYGGVDYVYTPWQITSDELRPIQYIYTMNEE